MRKRERALSPFSPISHPGCQDSTIKVTLVSGNGKRDTGVHLETVIQALSANRGLDKEETAGEPIENSDKAEKRTLSWNETAKDAGVLTMITSENYEHSTPENPEKKKTAEENTKGIQIGSTKTKADSPLWISHGSVSRKTCRIQQTCRPEGI